MDFFLNKDKEERKRGIDDDFADAMAFYANMIGEVTGVHPSSFARGGWVRGVTTVGVTTNNTEDVDYIDVTNDPGAEEGTVISNRKVLGIGEGEVEGKQEVTDQA